MYVLADLGDDDLQGRGPLSAGEAREAELPAGAEAVDLFSVKLSF